MAELEKISKRLSEQTNDASYLSGFFLLLEAAMTGFSSIPSFIGVGSIGLLIAMRQWEKYHTKKEIAQQIIDMQEDFNDPNNNEYFEKEAGTNEITNFQQDRKLYAFATGSVLFGAATAIGIINGVDHTNVLATIFEVTPPLLSAFRFMYVDTIGVKREEIELNNILGT